ncbi:MAG: hypothetical protein AAF824_02330 [Bacteroidota bacterium]
MNLLSFFQENTLSWRTRKPFIIFMFLLFWGMSFLQAQNGVGVRFIGNFHYFHQPEEVGLIDSWFSSGGLGVFWSQYKENSGVELGMNVIFKDPAGDGLPVIMQDFGDDQTISGLGAFELDLKAGPRFGILHPRIGAVLGYRWTASGFQEIEDKDINDWYFHLPFGTAVSFTSNFGYINTGIYYHVGVSNVLKNPNVDNFNGGRMRMLSVEISVIFASRKPLKK